MNLVLLLCLTLPGEPLLTLEGTVRDSSNRPVERAVVRLLPIDSRQRIDPERAVRALTDRDGRFRLSYDETAWRLRLDARANGFAPSLLDQIEPHSSHLEIGTVLLLPGRTIRGRVLDEAGQPIAGSEVFVRTAFHEGFGDEVIAADAVSDAAGRFTLEDLPAGQISLGFAAAGKAHMAIDPVDTRDPAWGEVEVALRPGRAAEGLVVHEEKPVEGALIELLRERLPDVFFRAPVYSDLDGRFRIAGLRTENEPLELRISGRELDATRFPLQADGGPATYSLERGVPARVSVSGDDASVGTIRSIHYEIYRRGSEGWQRESGTVAEDQVIIEEPHIWSFSLPRGDVARLTVISGDGRLTQVSEVKLDPDGTEVEVQFPLEVVLDGIVVDENGAPLGGQRIELGLPSREAPRFRPERVTTSEPDGSFRFRNLSPSSPIIRAFGPDRISEPLRVLLTPDGVSGSSELQAHPAAAVIGEVRVNREIPVPPVLVRAFVYQRSGRLGEWVESGAGLTDSSGRYRVAPLRHGLVALAAERPPDPAIGSQIDLRHRDPPAIGRDWPWLVRLGEGKESQFDIDVEWPERAWLEGTLRINEQVRAGVDLNLLDGDERRLDRLETDRKGRFRFRIEGDGRFLLHASSGTLRQLLEVDMSAGVDQSVRFDIAAGGVSGRLLPALEGFTLRAALEKFDPDAIAQDEEGPWRAVSQSAAEPDGRFAFDEVAAGRYRVSAQDVGKELALVASPPFVVQSMESAELEDLHMPRASTLIVHLKRDGSSSERLPFATVELRDAPGGPELPRKFVGWFVDEKATLIGLPPGKVTAHLQVYGPWEGSADQPVELPGEGRTATLTFTVKKID